MSTSEEFQPPYSLTIGGEGLNRINAGDYLAFIGLAEELGLTVTPHYLQPVEKPEPPNIAELVEKATDLGPFSFSISALNSWLHRQREFDVSSNAISRLKTALHTEATRGKRGFIGFAGDSGYEVRTHSWEHFRWNLIDVPGMGEVMANTFAAFVHDAAHHDQVQVPDYTNPYLRALHTRPIY